MLFLDYESKGDVHWGMEMCRVLTSRQQKAMPNNPNIRRQELKLVTEDSKIEMTGKNAI